MQVQLWARNIASGASTEITPSRPLHLTNVSISHDFRDAFSPTSLTLSVVLADRRTSPRYTIATLIAGQSNTLHVDSRYCVTRIPDSWRYTSVLSVLGYHIQTSDIGQSAPLNSRTSFPMNPNSTNQINDKGAKIAQVPASGMATSTPGPGSANDFVWGVPPMPAGTVSSSTLAGTTGANNPSPITSQNGHPLPNFGPNAMSARPMKPLRYRHANPTSAPAHPSQAAAQPSQAPPQPSQAPPHPSQVPSNTSPSPGSAHSSSNTPASNDDDHAHATKRVKNGDGTFTNRYAASDGEQNGRMGQHDGTIVSGTNTNKRKASAESGAVAGHGVIASEVNPTEKTSTADRSGAANYSSRAIPATTYPVAHMASSSSTDGRPPTNHRPSTMPYNTPRYVPQMTRPDQNMSSMVNQAGPSQFRFPMANHPHQKPMQNPSNDNSH
ncbi:hypothetical protein C8R42DRAFT_720639 [Lentinula raphanica]|nr:hypothetical protein C8R42DRAFT_720639 [Lentinula raphanica]